MFRIRHCKILSLFLSSKNWKLLLFGSDVGGAGHYSWTEHLKKKKKKNVYLNSKKMKKAREERG